MQLSAHWSHFLTVTLFSCKLIQEIIFCHSNFKILLAATYSSCPLFLTPSSNNLNLSCIYDFLVMTFIGVSVCCRFAETGAAYMLWLHMWESSLLFKLTGLLLRPRFLSVKQLQQLVSFPPVSFCCTCSIFLRWLY